MTKVHLHCLITKKRPECDVKLHKQFKVSATAAWKLTNAILLSTISITAPQIHDTEATKSKTLKERPIVVAALADITNTLPCLIYRKGNITRQVTGRFQKSVQLPKSRICWEI